MSCFNLEFEGLNVSNTTAYVPDDGNSRLEIPDDNYRHDRDCDRDRHHREKL